jgi:hypothetical protein
MDKFASILDRPSNEIERPASLPAGTYLAIVKGLPRYDKSSKKQTDFIEFTLGIQAAQDDVDEKELSNFLTKKDGSTRSLTDITMKNTYYLTEEAAWRLNKFFEDLGYDVSGDTTLREMAEDSANSEVYISVKHRPSQDGKSIFAEIAGTAKV